MKYEILDFERKIHAMCIFYVEWGEVCAQIVLRKDDNAAVLLSSQVSLCLFVGMHALRLCNWLSQRCVGKEW
jgi:hypothetical protein